MIPERWALERKMKFWLDIPEWRSEAGTLEAGKSVQNVILLSDPSILEFGGSQKSPHAPCMCL